MRGQIPYPFKTDNSSKDYFSFPPTKNSEYLGAHEVWAHQFFASVSLKNSKFTSGPPRSDVILGSLEDNAILGIFTT